MAGHRRDSGTLRRFGAATLLAVVLIVASGCRSGGAAAPPTTVEPPTTTGPVVATAPPVPAAAEDCGTLDELAGWPTTTTTPPERGYACIAEAVPAGLPAQMSVIAAGGGDSGRTTQGGYDLPTRTIFTWRVIGTDEVEETIDQTEDGGASVTRTCRGLAVTGPRPSGTDCE